MAKITRSFAMWPTALVAAVVLLMVGAAVRAHEHGEECGHGGEQSGGNFVDYNAIMRKKYTEHHVTGKVLSVEEKVIDLHKDPNYLTSHYRFLVHVTQVFQTTPETDPERATIRVGDVVSVVGWAAKTRPEDFRGDTGLAVVPETNTVYEFYIRTLGEKTPVRSVYDVSFPYAGEMMYSTIMPNGVVHLEEVADL